MPPSSSSSNTDGYDLVLRLLLGVLAVVVPLSHLAWLCGNLTASLAGGSWAPYQPTNALLHPEQVWPEARENALLIGARIVPVLLLLALGVTRSPCGSGTRTAAAAGRRSPAWPRPGTSSP